MVTILNDDDGVAGGEVQPDQERRVRHRRQERSPPQKEDKTGDPCEQSAEPVRLADDLQQRQSHASEPSFEPGRVPVHPDGLAFVQNQGLTKNPAGKTGGIVADVLYRLLHVFQRDIMLPLFVVQHTNFIIGLGTGRIQFETLPKML